MAFLQIFITLLTFASFAGIFIFAYYLSDEKYSDIIEKVRNKELRPQCASVYTISTNNLEIMSSWSIKDIGILCNCKYNINNNQMWICNSNGPIISNFALDVQYTDNANYLQFTIKQCSEYNLTIYYGVPWKITTIKNYNH